MPLIKGLRTTVDLLRLASAANIIDKELERKDNVYGNYAKNLDSMVQKGQLDPLKAEYLLEELLASQVNDSEKLLRQEEKAGIVLSRLVAKRAIDEVFAQEILYERFSTWSIKAALEHSPLTRQQ